jgi:release factor glutamine methyltransferase
VTATLEPREVGAVLRETAGRLRAARIATARQDAELLVARATGTSRLALIVDPARPVGFEALERLAALVARRAHHEPLQYILGEADFRGLRLAVGPGVFIPRPETELLVERALARLGAAAATVIDLCAGSGAVACALAAERPALAVWAVELCLHAATWARRNVAQLGLGDRVRVLDGDLFAPLDRQGLEGRCDLLVANPPYLRRSALGELPEEVRAFEPAPALDGGPDGLAVVTRILRQAPRFVRRGGRVLLEVGHDQAGLLREALGADPRYAPPGFHRDLLGHERILEVEVV